MSSRSSVSHSVASAASGSYANSLSRTRQNRQPARFSSRSRSRSDSRCASRAVPVLPVALDRQPALGPGHHEVDAATVHLHLRRDVEPAVADAQEHPLVEQRAERRVRVVGRQPTGRPGRPARAAD